MKASERTKARNEIADISLINEWTYCFAKVSNYCQIDAHAPSHENKVRHYKSWQEYADPWNWHPSCQQCHHTVEFNKGIRESVFLDWRNFLRINHPEIARGR